MLYVFISAKDFIVILVQDLTPADTEIGKVESFDRDEADNAKIFYRIEGSCWYFCGLNFKLLNYLV